MRTSAFASTAPLASCTVPEMAPVAPPCPKAGAASASAITARTTNLIEELAILFPLDLHSERILCYCGIAIGRHRQPVRGLDSARTHAACSPSGCPVKNASVMAGRDSFPYMPSRDFGSLPKHAVNFQVKNFTCTTGSAAKGEKGMAYKNRSLWGLSL